MKLLIQNLLRHFRKSPVALACVAFLGLWVLLAASAPWIAQGLGIPPDQQNLLSRFQPAGSTDSVSPALQEEELNRWMARQTPEQLQETVAQLRQVSAFSLLTASSTEELAPGESPFTAPLVAALAQIQETPEVLPALQASSVAALKTFGKLAASFTRKHYLGTDELGRDVLVRLLYGARISLSVAFFVGFFSALIGLLVGCLSGYFGGWLDHLLMRLTDALLSLPTIPIYILLSAADLKKIPGFERILAGENESIIKMILVLLSFSWMTMARIVRSSVLSIKENEYIAAAKTIGASSARIIALHLTPNVLGPLVVALTLTTGEALLVETALSFLGLGIQPPTPSWGNMLQNAMELVYSAPLLAILPGLMIFSIVLCVNFVGDALREALDPKSVKR